MLCVSGDPARVFAPHFMVIPSLSCPAACRYCFGPNVGPSMRQADADAAVSLIGRLAEETGQPDVRVTLHGGEPLAADYDVLERLIVGLHENLPGRRVALSVQSNLWLLTARHCALFRRYGAHLGTSLDGPRHLNDPQRGEGYFDRTMAGIQLAKQYGLSVGIIATVTAQTAEHYEAVFDFFTELGLPLATHVVSATPEGVGALALSQEQHAAFYRHAFEYYREHCGHLNLTTLNTLCRSVAGGEGAVCTLKDCFGRFIVIDPLGGIYSCTRFAGNPAYALGHVRDLPSASDLLGCDNARRFLDREMEVAHQCRGCEHYPYCKGGCPHTAFAENTFVSETFCHVHKTVFGMIRQGLIHECVSSENRDALAAYGCSLKDNPLGRAGWMTALAKPQSPFEVQRSLKRILAAYELAQQEGSIDKTVAVLADLHIGKSDASLRRSLLRLRDQLAWVAGDRPEKPGAIHRWAAPDMVEQAPFIPKAMGELVLARYRGGDVAAEGRACGACWYRYLCGGILHMAGVQPNGEMNSPFPVPKGLCDRADELYRYALQHQAKLTPA